MRKRREQVRETMTDAGRETHVLGTKLLVVCLLCARWSGSQNPGLISVQARANNGRADVCREICSRLALVDSQGRVLCSSAGGICTQALDTTRMSLCLMKRYRRPLHSLMNSSETEKEPDSRLMYSRKFFGFR